VTQVNEMAFVSDGFRVFLSFYGDLLVWWSFATWWSWWRMGSWSYCQV